MRGLCVYVCGTCVWYICVCVHHVWRVCECHTFSLPSGKVPIHAVVSVCLLHLALLTALHHTLPDNTSVPMIPLVNSNETAPALGCREPPLMWCSHVPRIILPQLIISLVVMTLSYSMATVTSFSIFSRILGPFPQVSNKMTITASAWFGAPAGDVDRFNKNK